MATAFPVNIAIDRTDLPTLPADWRWVQFSETCERVSVGHVGPTTEFFTDAEDGIRLLRSQNVRSGKLEMENAVSITPDFHKKLKKSQLRSGDILFVRVGANRGDCCVVPNNVGELNCANIVFARPKHPTGFHAYFFQSELGQHLLLSASVGAAQGVINTSSVATMPVPVPPLSVQRRIASTLSAYDELIENNQRRIRILEEMARSLYREWFVYFRYPSHESVPLVDSPLGQIPQGWECGRLDEVLVLQRGFDLPKDKREDGTVPIIAATGINGFHSIAKVKAPGVVTGRSGSIGTVLYVQDDFWPLNTALWVKEFPKSEPLFAYYLLSSLELKQFNSGAAVPTLNRNDVHGVQVVIPPRELQRRFQLNAGAMLKQAEILQRQSTNLRRTRDLLLPRLLSGQVAIPEQAT